MNSTAQNVLIYDGDCGFCTTTAKIFKERDPNGELSISPWQSLNLADFELTEKEVTTAAYWVDKSGQNYRGHKAVGRVLISFGSIYKPFGLIILIPPFSWIASLVYRLIAKCRHKLPGGTNACKLPNQP